MPFRHSPSFRPTSWAMEHTHEQANFPAEQPSSREGARFPSPYAHPCRSRDPRRASPQGPHRALRVTLSLYRDCLSDDVLSRENRITRASDFRTTVRSGRRLGTPHSVIYVAAQANTGPTRFGFIVSKAVGNSVIRHRMTRRLRAIGHEVLADLPVGVDVIIRSLPGSDEIAWATLHADVEQALAKITDRGVTTR